MTEHTFTPILDGDVVARLHELYEWDCDDMTFGGVDDVQYADMERELGTARPGYLVGNCCGGNSP